MAWSASLVDTDRERFYQSAIASCALFIRVFKSNRGDACYDGAVIGIFSVFSVHLGPEMASMNGSGHSLSLLVREKSRSYLTSFPYKVEDLSSSLTRIPETYEDVEFSADGKLFVGIEGTEHKAVVRNASTAELVSEFGGSDDAETPLKVRAATFSPRGTFVLTWSRPVPGVNSPNLVIYRADRGEKVAQFHQKIFAGEHWPSIQWSDDESVAARCVTNIVHFFRGNDIGAGPTSRLDITGVTNISIARGSQPYHVAAFIAGKAGQPGRVTVYQHPDNGGEEIVQRSTFRADSVDFKWASTGRALLALVSTNVDATGKSYYGESEVYFVDISNKTIQRIDLPQEGPTYDVSWSPTGLEFVLIYGYMPSRATMFNEKCDPVFDFGSGSRNMVSFSPHGRYLVLAGFGSLAGQVEFWDKNKMIKVGVAALPCTTAHCWSPCSRYFLSATTFPRLRIDNALRVVRVDGLLIHEHKIENSYLLQASFKPSPRSSFPDPKFTVDQMIGGALRTPEQAASALANVSTGKDAPRFYRPPGARGLGGDSGSSIHENLQPTKVDKSTFFKGNGTFSSGGSAISASRRPREIPGLYVEEEQSSTKSKNALKRKKKKERDARQASASGMAAQSTSEHPDKPADPSEITTVEAASKRIKALKKKLRQIEVLKAEVKEGKTVNVDQDEKLKSETVLSAQLKELEQKFGLMSASHVADS